MRFDGSIAQGRQRRAVSFSCKKTNVEFAPLTHDARGEKLIQGVAHSQTAALTFSGGALEIADRSGLESVLKSGMCISSDKVSTHGDEDHGVRDVDALFIVAHEAPPARHPSECALDHLAAGQDLESLLVVGSRMIPTTKSR